MSSGTSHADRCHAVNSPSPCRPACRFPEVGYVEEYVMERGGDVTCGAGRRVGRLKVFLGAAPGVGKTYRMLDEGRRRAARGTRADRKSVV